jgi:DNA invertase Pin-like site-specific DNA recombinase
LRDRNHEHRNELEQKGAGLRVLEAEFFTSTDTGPILVAVLGMVAEMERGSFWSASGRASRLQKKRGVYKGRKPSDAREEVRKMRSDGPRPAG